MPLTSLRVGINMSDLISRVCYVDMIAPNHERTTCDDYNLYNAAYGDDDNEGLGRCYRCTLLRAAKGIPDDGEY